MQVLYFFIYSKHSYYISVKYQTLHHFIFPHFGQLTIESKANISIGAFNIPIVEKERRKLSYGELKR